jgi:type 1 glutamine amidotransferase
MKPLFACILLIALAAQAAGDIPAHRAKQIFDAAPAKPTTKPAKPRRVLIFNTPAHLMDKDPHKGYCIPFGAAAMEALGRKTGAFEPVVSDDLAHFLPDNLRRFDAVVLNNTSGPWITPTAADMAREGFRKHGADKTAVERALRKSFLDFIESGGGLVAYHFAIAANRQWPQFRDLFGATFTGHPWNEEVGIRVEEPAHPLVAAFGGKDFRLADEIYQYGPPYDRGKLRILLSLDTDRTNMTVPWIHRKDNDFALAWVRQHGKGRIFYTSFGHRTELYWNPQVLRFYLDAIQFACGDLDAPIAPRPAGK